MSCGFQKNDKFIWPLCHKPHRNWKEILRGRESAWTKADEIYSLSGPTSRDLKQSPIQSRPDRDYRHTSSIGPFGGLFIVIIASMWMGFAEAQEEVADVFQVTPHQI